MSRKRRKTEVMKRPLLALALAAVFLGRAEAEERGERVVSRARVCMLQDSVQPKDGLPYEYQGKTYYLCCGGCKATFAANPERFSKAVDPVTGEAVDKAEASAYAYHGRAYFFSTEKSLSAFAADPDRYLLNGKTSPSAPGDL